MGCWDEYCLVCGGPPSAPLVDYVFEDFEGKSEEEKESLRAGLIGMEWLDSYVGVLGTEERIPLGEYDCYGGFENFHDRYELTLTAAHAHYEGRDCDLEHKEDLALTCHDKCYTLLQRELGYTLRFQDVWPMLMEQIQISKVSSTNPWTRNCMTSTYNSFCWTSYGGIGVYEDQSFLFAQAITDGNAWMLQDPTINERNASRIVEEVWRPLVENGFRIPPQSFNGNLESKFVDLGLRG